MENFKYMFCVLCFGLCLNYIAADQHYSVQTPQPTPSPSNKRSHKCLIALVAQINHINLTYALISEKGPPHNRIYTYRMHLGTERYLASGTSKKRAEDKASREGYALTHYPKPPLNDRTCKTFNSDISDVNTWAQRKGYQLTCSVIDQKIGPPRLYTYECSILGTNIRAQAEGRVKKEAKNDAMQQLKQQIDNYVEEVVDNGLKYNTTTKLVYLHPISRLNQIQSSRHKPDPVYKKLHETLGFDNKTHHVAKNFFVEARVGDEHAVGHGTTLKEARYTAAVNVLKMMSFQVPANMTNYMPKTKKTH